MSHKFTQLQTNLLHCVFRVLKKYEQIKKLLLVYQMTWNVDFCQTSRKRPTNKHNGKKGDSLPKTWSPLKYRLVSSNQITGLTVDALGKLKPEDERTKSQVYNLSTRKLATLRETYTELLLSIVIYIYAYVVYLQYSDNPVGWWGCLLFPFLSPLHLAWQVFQFITH